MTRWFVGIASDEEVDRLEKIQSEIERLNFADPERNRALDLEFHSVIYDRHYNRDAYDTWRKHLDLLSIFSSGFSVAISRRTAVVHEHRGIIDCVKRQDADGAAAMVASHVEGSCQHMIEQLRSSERT
ncbi:FCD domain-containing protein [Devosia algicola]|uniref:FCD domain-containing protein n=1 Tax=Devosia algicola TaxID=3026418 RepID=A0ABY7YN54_9HYPH|nr:FCD domain-containing protein [Devosia algicola]WDR02659.1 FCD domain-containing protein [Devosia algicola]